MVRIELSRLSKTFGTVVALDDVSLVVDSGELFFLLGPSGCGKTTLLRCVAGFCTPDRGRICFDDADVTDRPAHRRDTGMVFQNYALWPHMTVAENIAFGLEVRHIPRRRRQALVQQALSAVRLDELGGRRPNELSGGQQQRVALARALVIEPRCLLLDEPLSNLDAKLRLEMRAEIRSICKTANLTALYVTHDQKEALAMADRIAVMRDGRIEQVGTPKELYDRPANRFVASFLGETNLLNGTVTEVRDDTIRVGTEIGELVSGAFPSGAAVGQSVICSVRPEAIRFGAAPSGRDNAFGGRLTDTVYLGEMARYRLIIDGHALTVFELNPKAVERGSDVEMPFWIDRDDVVILLE